MDNNRTRLIDALRAVCAEVEQINRARRSDISQLASRYPGLAALCAQNYLRIHNEGFQFLSSDDVDFYTVMANPAEGITDLDRAMYEQFSNPRPAPDCSAG